MKAKLSVVNNRPDAKFPVAEFIEATLDCLADKTFAGELIDVVTHAREMGNTIELAVQHDHMDAPEVIVPSIEQIAAECRAIVEKARLALGHELGGGSMQDLCADNTLYPLETIRIALIVAGLGK